MGIELVTEANAKRRMKLHMVMTVVWVLLLIVVAYLKDDTPYIMTAFAFLYLFLDEAMNAGFYYNIYRAFQKSSETGGTPPSNEG